MVTNPVSHCRHIIMVLRLLVAGVAAAHATAARNRAATPQTRYFTSIPAMGASVGRALKKTLSGPDFFPDWTLWVPRPFLLLLGGTGIIK